MLMQSINKLVLPTVGFVAPWGFIPCGRSPCFEPQDCEDCGNTLENGIWVDFPALTNDGCTTCEDYENTYFLDGLSIGHCGTSLDIGSFCEYPKGEFGFLEAVYVFSLGKCYLEVSLSDVITNPLCKYLGYIKWQLELTAPANPIDHIVPYYGAEWGPTYPACIACDAVGTTVRVYE